MTAISTGIMPRRWRPPPRCLPLIVDRTTCQFSCCSLLWPASTPTVDAGRFSVSTIIVSFTDDNLVIICLGLVTMKTIGILSSNWGDGCSFRSPICC